MHNFDRYLIAALLVLALHPRVSAQGQDGRDLTATPEGNTSPAGEPGGAVPASKSATSAAGARYSALHEQDLLALNSTASTADDFRTIINRYWSFVRRYPTSGYADNALWQAANLSAESFRRFSQDRDKNRAVQLLQWLRDQYPHSSLRGFALSRLAELDTVSAAASATPTMPPAAPEVSADVATPAGASSPAAPPGAVTIRAVQREVLSEVVRVTVELDQEVPFFQERIEGPARLFFDLKGTKTVPALVDATFRYNSDIVRHIRLGRHPNTTTRIVLDLENVSRYSVFTLYNPYRIVIDAERVDRPERNAPILIAGRTIKATGTSVAVIVPRAAIAPRPPVAPKPTVAKSELLPVGIPVVASRLYSPITLNPPVGPKARVASKARPVTNAPVALNAPPAPSAPVASNAPVIPAPQLATLDVETPATMDKPLATRKPISPATNSSGKFSVARQLGLGVSRIVIDAGHGGHDPGAQAHGIAEAELVLDVALRLETLLSQQPGMEVVLTRKTDDYISLDERTQIANRESADLFLSIHANASATATARGVETYFLNFALNPQAEAVAARENAASGRNMNSLPSIIKAITLNSKLNESRDFAASVQRALVRGMRPGNKTIRDLGVKQAPFVVLIGAAMPSVLAEISFVTNRQEARLLKTPAYRQRIAESLLAGILRYQDSLKKVQTAALQ